MNTQNPDFVDTRNSPISTNSSNFVLEEAQIEDFDRMSIADVERSGDLSDLWVLNTSSGNFAGAISITATDDAGESRGLEIPYTFVAINLADMMAPERIIRSNSFRRAVARGFITIVTPQRAKLQNSGPSAKVELEKIRQGISVGVAESAETMGSINANAPQISVSTGSVTQVGGGSSERIDPENMVDSRIQRIMNDDGISADEKLNLLRSNRESIKLVDAMYIKRCATADDADEIVTASKKMIKTLKTRAFNNDPNIDWAAKLEVAGSFARRAMMGG